MALTLAVVLVFRLVLPQREFVLQVHMLTPLLATLLMLFVFTRDGYKGKNRLSLGLISSGRQTWLAAFLLPLPILAVIYGLGWVSGAAAFAAPTEAGWLPDFLISWLINFLIIVILVTAEEIGFRGYLLPHLQDLGDTWAILLFGFLHGVWHLPAALLTSFYLAEGNPWLTIPLFLLLLTAVGWIYGKLRLATRSIWPGVILHASFNVFLGVFASLTVMSSPLSVYLVGESGVVTLLVTAVVAYWLMKHWPKPNKVTGVLDTPVKPLSAAN